MVPFNHPMLFSLAELEASLSFQLEKTVYNPDLEPIPEDSPTGRKNNQGFEGLIVNSEGTKLYVLLQSAANQDGGLGKDGENRNLRFLIYDITNDQPECEAEYVVQLLLVDPDDHESDTAGQSEIHYISDTQSLILALDKDASPGQDETESKYRHVDIFDTSKATNVKGSKYDCSTCRIASGSGKLSTSITPAQYCS